MTQGHNRGEIDALTGTLSYGVIQGLIFRKPSSGLVVTYEGGQARVKSSTLGKQGDEYTIAGSTHTFTASKDTYVYVNGADGVLTYSELALGADKPTQEDIGDNSEFLYKVVTGAANTDSVTRLWARAAHGPISTVQIKAGFTTTTVGAVYIKAPFGGRILKIRGVVTTAMGGTDAGTVTASIEHDGVATAVTGGVVTIALSSALGVRAEATSTAANVFEEGDDIKLVSAKTTTGGEAMVEVVLEKLR